MYRRPILRTTVGVLLYVAMVTVGTLAFEGWRQGDPFGSPPPFVYVLCGPALSLFTHDALLLAIGRFLWRVF